MRWRENIDPIPVYPHAHTLYDLFSQLLIQEIDLQQKQARLSLLVVLPELIQ